MKQGISLPQIPKNLQTDNKELYDYLFGLQQALLAKQTDDYGAVDKVSSGSVPIGTILMYAVATAPTNYLICDGSAISRTTYAGLFAVIGTVYGAGDGTTTFNLPNYQAVVPKGVGAQTINTRSKTGPAFAVVEEDQMQTITGTFGVVDNDITSLPSAYSVKVLGTGAFTAGTEETGSYFFNIGTPVSGTGYRVVGFSSANSPEARAGTTTRENSIGTNFIIRYQ